MSTGEIFCPRCASATLPNHSDRYIPNVSTPANRRYLGLGSRRPVPLKRRGMRLKRVTATGRAGRWDVPITVADIPYVIKQVAKCLRLAEECNDGEISAGLLELARAFADCARKLGADPDLI